MSGAPDQSARPCRIGCVSFLNARPLIDGLDAHDQLDVRYDVPSALLDDLLNDTVDLALCPVVDFQLSPTPLLVAPVGGIGCDGPTLTVRLYGRRPIRELTRIHADTDSHTSVLLMRLILQEVYGARPAIEHLAARQQLDPDDICGETDGVLLIGDKVVTRAPDEGFRHQLDLGEAWKQWTGLPFVFAIWMARVDRPLGEAPALLDRQRERNAGRIDEIVERHAPRAGWPADLAKTYLGWLLKYETGPRELAAIETFWRKLEQAALLDRRRPMALYPAQNRASVG